MTREEALKWFEKNMRHVTMPGAHAAHEAAIAALRGPTIEQVVKPEPLTEDELREMVGRPIWIETAKRKEWCLLWGFHGPEVYGRSFIFTRRTAQKEPYQFSELGVTWWPYRRAPEGEK